MRLASLSRFAVATAALCLLSAVMIAQESSQPRRTTNAPPKPSGATPRTADGHPDLTGVWNGLGDNLNGIPNQIANNGLSIESDSVTRDLHSGLLIAHVPAEHHTTAEQRAGRACGRPAPARWIQQTYLQAGILGDGPLPRPQLQRRRSVEQLHAGRHSARRHPVGTSASSRRISCSSIPARAA